MFFIATLLDKELKGTVKNTANALKICYLTPPFHPVRPPPPYVLYPTVTLPCHPGP